MLKLARAAISAFALVALSPASASATASRCAFPSPPVVLMQEGDAHAKGGKLLQMWEAPDGPVWTSTARPEGYETFLAKVRAKAGETDPVRLLDQTGFENSRRVAASAADWIGPASCLEMLLQQVQDDRLDTFTEPTEFMALVLRSADGARLRIYFYTVNDDGIGRATPVTGPAAQAHREGWKIVAALHNHNFHPGQPGMNAQIAPSAPDAQFAFNLARSAGLSEAWITNGLHTSRIPASAFAAFEGAQ